MGGRPEGIRPIVEESCSSRWYHISHHGAVFRNIIQEQPPEKENKKKKRHVIIRDDRQLSTHILPPLLVGGGLHTGTSSSSRRTAVKGGGESSEADDDVRHLVFVPRRAILNVIAVVGCDDDITDHQPALPTPALLTRCCGAGPCGALPRCPAPPGKRSRPSAACVC